MNELSDIEEQQLNPPPRPYRVSYSNKKIFVAISLLGLCFYVFFMINKRLAQRNFLLQNEIAAVNLAPTSVAPFTVVDVDTKQEKQINFVQDRFTLLNIWGSFCPPCLQEMPSLDWLAKQWGTRLSVVAIAIDDDLHSVEQYIGTHHPGFTIAWDQQKNSLKIFGVAKYPESFLISPDGYLITQFSGPRDWASVAMQQFFSNKLGSQSN